MRAQPIHIALLVGIIGAVGVLVWDLVRPSPPFALPDSSERTLLAEQQASCAGAYVVFKTTLKKENTDFQELEKTFSAALERHVTLTLLLYRDESKAKSKIENFSAAFIAEIKNAYDRKIDLAALIDDKKSECVRVEVKTLDFIKRAKLDYAARY